MSSYPGYTPTDWVDNTTLVDEARLDKMELGIKNAADAVQDLDKRVAGAGGTMTGEWSYVNTTAAPPAAGQVRFDQNPPPAATKVWISNMTAPGVDAKNLLLQTKKGQKLYFQDKDDATKWVEFVATADATDQGTYVEIAVQLEKNGGSLATGQRLLVAVTRTTTSTDLIGRLGPEALLISDWNATLDNGWYKAAAGANAPAALAGQSVIGRVERESTRVTQTVWATALGAALLATKYERRYDGTSWGAWIAVGSAGYLGGVSIAAANVDLTLPQPAAAVTTFRVTAGGGSLRSISAPSGMGARCEVQLTAGVGAVTLLHSVAGGGGLPLYIEGATSVTLYPGQIAEFTMVDGVAWVLTGITSSAQSSRTIPIQLTTPRTASFAGNTFWTVAPLTAIDLGHWEFVKDVEGHLYGQIRISEPRSETSAVVLSLIANAVAGVTRMQVGLSRAQDGVSLNPAGWFDLAAQDITMPATAYLRKDVVFPLTGVTGGFQVNDLVFVKIAHLGAHANDTLAVNTLLVGAWLTGG